MSRPVFEIYLQDAPTNVVSMKSCCSLVSGAKHSVRCGYYCWRIYQAYDSLGAKTQTCKHGSEAKVKPNVGVRERPAPDIV